MRLLFRVDGNPSTGGGHVARCLALALWARGRGHHVAFAMAGGAGNLNRLVQAQAIEVTELPPMEHRPEPRPPHAGWLRLPWAEDAKLSAGAAARFRPDWIVLDHYGLDARWVAALRARCDGARILAVDELDDRDLAADLLLDQARIAEAPRRFPAPATLDGPRFVLLRPEFAAARKAALARRGQAVRRVLVAPGMMDVAGLAPLALRELAGRTDLAVDVVMGSASRWADATRMLVAGHPNRHLTLDANDMARRMTAADACIGAGGMTSWERCCLGLPAVAVAVAGNQAPGVRALAAAGAVIGLELDAARRSGALAAALKQLTAEAAAMSRRARAICDGRGAGRVLAALCTAFP